MKVENVGCQLVVSLGHGFGVLLWVLSLGLPSCVPVDKGMHVTTTLIITRPTTVEFSVGERLVVFVVLAQEPRVVVPIDNGHVHPEVPTQSVVQQLQVIMVDFHSTKGLVRNHDTVVLRGECGQRPFQLDPLGFSVTGMFRAVFIEAAHQATSIHARGFDGRRTWEMILYILRTFAQGIRTLSRATNFERK